MPKTEATLTETLRQLAETEPLTPHSKPVWFFPWVCCSPQTMKALCAVAETAHEAMRTQDTQIAATVETDDPKWHEAFRAQLEAERALRVALEALDQWRAS